MIGKDVDLRSDTVTWPTVEMREAMARAVVGDDVYGEDPTVKQLEQEGAACVGKEEALFLPSGTMGNLVAVLSHTGRGDAVLLDSESHIFYYEAGGASVLGGVQFWPLDGLHEGDGAVEMITKGVRPPDQHFAPVRLLCLENTHNRLGGVVMPAGAVEEVCSAARHLGLAVHLDGARIFNAAAALQLPVTDFTRHCDSVMFCLSKGLGAPVGSLLAGTSTFIARARRNRKLLGGGMRQAGILAAAGLLALEHRHALQEDHRRARELAREIAALPGLEVDPFPPPTNMIIVHTGGAKCSPEQFCAFLAEQGIKAIPFGENRVRMVTHRDIDDEDIQRAINGVKACSRHFQPRG